MIRCHCVHCGVTLYPQSSYACHWHPAVTVCYSAGRNCDGHGWPYNVVRSLNPKRPNVFAAALPPPIWSHEPCPHPSTPC